MKKQNRHKKPRRRKRKRRLVNNQRGAQKDLTPDCSGHVAQANWVHELVPKDNRPPSGKKGDPQPQQRPPTKKAPEGAHQ
jgi:hypothetical protein